MHFCTKVQHKFALHLQIFSFRVERNTVGTEHKLHICCHGKKVKKIKISNPHPRYFHGNRPISTDTPLSLDYSCWRSHLRWPEKKGSPAPLSHLSRCFGWRFLFSRRGFLFLCHLCNLHLADTLHWCWWQWGLTTSPFPWCLQSQRKSRQDFFVLFWEMLILPHIQCKSVAIFKPYWLFSKQIFYLMAHKHSILHVRLLKKSNSNNIKKIIKWGWRKL